MVLQLTRQLEQSQRLLGYHQELGYRRWFRKKEVKKDSSQRDNTETKLNTVITALQNVIASLKIAKESLKEGQVNSEELESQIDRSIKAFSGYLDRAQERLRKLRGY